MENSTRAIVNTIIQYFRTIINIVLSLYSTRLVLNALGVEDYGIFTLVSGIISLLSFIINAMVVTTQRYISFYSGHDNLSELKQIFSTSLMLHIVLGLLTVVLVEISGIFLFDYYLNISPQKIGVAKSIFHLSIFILFITFSSAPYRALLIAHENLVYISCIDIIDGILKLVFAIIISLISYDNLFIYVLMLSGLSVFNFLSFFIYDVNKYPECTLPRIKYISVQFIKEISNFAWWTIYSVGCITGRTQGVSLVLNHYFGVISNAAYGLALQVNGAFLFLSNSLLNALNPQIMKQEGCGNRERMLRLSEIESKFSFYLISMVAIPCIFELDSILHIWLGEIPQYAVYFCGFMIASSMIDSLTVGLGSANQAIGNIKIYSLVINTTKLITIFVISVGLWFYDSIYLVMPCYAALEAICALLRLAMLHKLYGLSISGYCKRVLIPEIWPVTASVLTCLLTTKYISHDYRFIMTMILSFMVFAITVYLLGLCNDEKEIINRNIKLITNKIL